MGGCNTDDHQTVPLIGGFTPTNDTKKMKHGDSSKVLTFIQTYQMRAGVRCNLCPAGKYRIASAAAGISRAVVNKTLHKKNENSTYVIPSCVSTPQTPSPVECRR